MSKRLNKKDILNDLWTAFGLQKIVLGSVSEDYKNDEKFDPNDFDARLLSVLEKNENGEWEIIAEVRWRNVDTLYLIHYGIKKEMSTTFKDKKDVDKFFNTCADFICKISERTKIKLHRLGE
jgi:hypothetical protein